MIGVGAGGSCEAKGASCLTGATSRRDEGGTRSPGLSRGAGIFEVLDFLVSVEDVGTGGAGGRSLKLAGGALVLMTW